jgi:gamma-glutamylcyclotransferase (GGCT)/AIG2-like uncharacterized protein YtfP
MALVSNPERIAFYGTLMRDQGVQKELNAAVKLKHTGNCSIPGVLYDLGEYPGIVEGEGSVLAELYEILDPSVLVALDEYEDFQPANPSQSLFVRRRVHLNNPPMESWVYFYNHPVQGKKLIWHGDWTKYSRNRRS